MLVVETNINSNFVGQLAKYFKFTERMGDDIPPQQRIEDMIRVAELCVELLKENNEYHGEVRIYSNQCMVEGFCRR
jgi:hypothetical protein